jgi:hypothetical protein
MSRALPFPISFTLPPQWSLVAADSCGQPDAACVAIRNAQATDPIATNIVVSGYALDGDTNEVIALTASDLMNLQSQFAVTVLKDELLGDAAAPEIAQLLQIDYPTGESTITVKQIRITNVFPSTENPNHKAVLRLVMTCPTEVFEMAGPEFGQFVASIALPQ